MPKQARLSTIKGLRCYTIEEAAEVCNVSERTVRSWAKDGLKVMHSVRPALIRGDDLRTYIKSRRKSRAIKTEIDTFYCVCCRKVQRAAAGLADCEIKGGRAKLTALCEECGTVVSKPIAEMRIPEIAQTLELKITRP